MGQYAAVFFAVPSVNWAVEPTEPVLTLLSKRDLAEIAVN